jgi:hypothetical protein
MRTREASFTLGLLIGLILAGALAVALLATPLAPLVVALGIILPGFLIERNRGGTGIVGGTASSAILAVSAALLLGLVSYLFGGSTFEQLLGSLPAIYLLLVVSLLWGGVASGTLYFVVKACREPRQAPALSLLRMRFTLGQLMGVIGACAVVSALLTTPFAVVAAAVATVFPGFLIDRLRGHSGIIGGMLSACVASIGLWLAAYVYFSFVSPEPTVVDYLGSPPISLPLLGIAGLAWGALIGTLLNLAILTARSYRDERGIRWLDDLGTSIDDPRPQSGGDR